VRAVQSSFDFRLRTPQTRADFFAWHAPAVAIPADRVIVGYLAPHAHAENSLQPLVWIQPSMGIARPARCHRETLFPRRKKTHL
jgi:hypothetical protein